MRLLMSNLLHTGLNALVPCALEHEFMLLKCATPKCGNTERSLIHSEVLTQYIPRENNAHSFPEVLLTIY